MASATAQRLYLSGVQMPLALRIAALALLGSLIACQTARAQAPPTLILGQAPTRPSEQVYLEVIVNGQSTSLIVPFTVKLGHLTALGKDLHDIGIATDKLGIADTAEVALDTLPGVQYQYDVARLRVELTLSDAVRRPNVFDARNIAPAGTASSARGLILNYDAYAQTTPTVRLSVYNEWRFFAPSGVFSQTGIFDDYQKTRHYTRYDTAWTQSRPDTLTTLQVGDTISSSLSWSRSIRIGGIQYRRNFALRPDLITFPIPSLRGTSVVPSSVDLYINDVRQFSSQVPSGPFVLNQVPGINGAGQATVVTRDALGRSVATTIPLYVDTRLLAKGLTSYSFEGGFVRRNYGVESFDYSRRPALSESTQYGLSDDITVTSHAEASTNVANAGVGALLRMGMAGVVNGSLSASTGEYSGGLFSLGYQLIQQKFSIDAQTIRTTSRYGDLAAATGSPVPTATDRVTLTFPLLSTQSVALSYIGYKLAGIAPSHITSLSYMLNVGNLTSFNVSLYRDLGAAGTSGMFIGMNIGLGSAHGSGNQPSLNTTVGRQDGQNTYSVNATKSPNYDGGFGWSVQSGRSGSVAYQQAQAQVIGNVGEVTAAVSKYGGTVTSALDVSGALVLMDGSLLMSRRIDDSFALVSADGAKGIPVLHENRVIGKTNSAGHLLIPDLNAYQHNQVSIDSTSLPADVQIPVTSMDMVPASRSGMLAHFAVTHFDAASVVLLQANGQPVPEGTIVHHRESGDETIVGFDGIAFLTHLQADNHLDIATSRPGCVVRFSWKRPDDGNLLRLGPFRCAPAPNGSAPHTVVPTGATQ